MNHVAVSSSNIVSVGYDADSKAMQVKTRTGKTYEYQDVPSDIHEGLMSAPSIGSFLHANVRGKFEHREVA